MRYYDKKTKLFQIQLYTGVSLSYYKKRYPKKIVELNINKSIKEQFNLLRIADPENYPSFFYKNGKKIILKVEE